MNTDLRKAQKHIQRATELLNPKSFGFGGTDEFDIHKFDTYNRYVRETDEEIQKRHKRAAMIEVVKRAVQERNFNEVLQEIKNYGPEAFFFAIRESDGLKRDREFVLAAVKLNGMALQHASEELRKDRVVVLAAIQQNGMALAFASNGLRGDKNIVDQAVHNNKLAMVYASSELKGRMQKEMDDFWKRDNGIEQAWHKWCEKSGILPSENVLEIQLGEIGDTLSMNDLVIGKSCYIVTKNYKDQQKVNDDAKGCITFKNLQYFQDDGFFKIVVWGIGLEGGHQDTQLFQFTYNLPNSPYVADGYPLGWNLTYAQAAYIYDFQLRCSEEQSDQQQSSAPQRSSSRYRPYFGENKHATGKT